MLWGMPAHFSKGTSLVYILLIRHTYLQGRLGNVVVTVVAMCSAKTPEE